MNPTLPRLPAGPRWAAIGALVAVWRDGRTRKQSVVLGSGE
jgi:hypothetical protein